jgi:hypothetical protein
MALHSTKSFEDLKSKDDGFPTHTTEEQVTVLLLEIVPILSLLLSTF